MQRETRFSCLRSVPMQRGAHFFERNCIPMQAALDFHPIGPIWWVWTGLSGLICLDRSLDRSVWIRSVWIRSVWIRSVWVRSVWIPSVWILSGSLQSLLPHPPSHHPHRSPSPSLLSASAGCGAFWVESEKAPKLIISFI